VKENQIRIFGVKKQFGISGKERQIRIVGSKKTHNLGLCEGERRAGLVVEGETRGN
jgi:hypothetical protein